MAIEDYMTVAEPTDELIETDAVVVGAGPVGLFQVFELGLLEIKCHVIDSLRNVGGQCMELYPTKPIYDIPAVPVCSSYELTENLLKQNHHFGPVFHLGQEVTRVEKQEDGRFYVETSTGTRFMTKVVIIAAGVGSFQPRPLRVKGIEKFEGTQLHYSCKDPSVFEGKNVVICGGGDSALDWTLNLVGRAESVVLVHRRDGFRAQAASVAKMKELCENWAELIQRIDAKEYIISCPPNGLDSHHPSRRLVNMVLEKIPTAKIFKTVDCNSFVFYYNFNWQLPYQTPMNTFDEIEDYD